MLTMAGGWTELTRFCMAMKPPKVALVLAQAATTMAASGAAALAHSASRIAPPSSPAQAPRATPGAAQLFVPLAGARWTIVSEPELHWERPKVVRKVVQSEAE